MEKILVTGGCGYIGSHVVRKLSEAGYRVVVYDNLSTGFAEALIYGEELIEGDLADTAKLEAVFKEHHCKTVLHFAAAIVAPESVTQPLKYYRNNTANTLNLLTVCARHRVERFVFSSTAAVYGIPADGRAVETSATLPINPYGASKLMSEWMLRDLAASSPLRHVTLRYFNVAGADPQARMGQRTREATHLLQVSCQAALGLRHKVAIFGTDYATPDGTGIRDYIHVEDLATAHLAALGYLEQGNSSQTLNVGYGRGASVREIISLVKEVSGVDFKVVESPRRPGDPAILVADATRIREILGWKPQYDSCEQIVADAWRWEQRLVAAE